MANMKVPIVSLNGGKGSPLIDVRSDTTKYRSLCRELRNFIPRIYGPVTRRPGTLDVAGCEDNTTKSRLVPFVFSSEIAYDLEFSQNVLNVYFDKVFITTVASPYQEADLFQLQFNQSADVMWITHPDYPQKKLSRTTATTFTLEDIVFENGPFQKRNDLENNDGITIGVTGYTIATATLGDSGLGIFTIASTTDISDQFPLNHRFYVTGSSGDPNNDEAYTVLSSSWAADILTVTPNEEVLTSNNDGEIMVDDATVTLTASSSTFQNAHVGTLFKLTSKRQQVITKGIVTDVGVIGEPIDVKDEWTFTTTGNWGQTVEIQRLADGTNWETFRSYTSTLASGVGSRNVQKSDTEKDLGVQYRMNVISVDSPAGKLSADITVSTSTQDSIFRVTSFVSGTEVKATAIVAAPDNIATVRWAEGSWSDVRGYPSSVAFFEERIVYGFSNSDQQTIWLSGTGDFEDFDTGTNDDNAFTLKVLTANRGRWISSMDSLAIGMSGDEWRIRSSALDQPLTPTDFSIKRQTKFGSAKIQAMAVNEAIIFVDSVARKVREYTFSDPKQKFVSPDLTSLAEDITKGGITSMAVQTNPDNIIWFTIAEAPYLISMTYEREQNVVSWAEHPVGGNGEVESISITPGTAEDIITLSVKRTINGSVVRRIEQMQPRDWGEDTNIFFVDSGVINTSNSTTIPVPHLEGETVQVIVDGAQQSDKVVSGGQITIDEAGARAVVGLSYGYLASPMRLDNEGSTYGSIKKIHEVVLSLFKSMNVNYGDGTDSYSIDFRTTENYDNPPGLFTGDTGAIDGDGTALSFPNGFTTEDTLEIFGSDPFPVTIRAIIPRLDKTGR